MIFIENIHFNHKNRCTLRVCMIVCVCVVCMCAGVSHIVKYEGRNYVATVLDEEKQSLCECESFANCWDWDEWRRVGGNGTLKCFKRCRRKRVAGRSDRVLQQRRQANSDSVSPLMRSFNTHTHTHVQYQRHIYTAIQNYDFLL